MERNARVMLLCRLSGVCLRQALPKRSAVCPLAADATGRRRAVRDRVIAAFHRDFWLRATTAVAARTEGPLSMSGEYLAVLVAAPDPNDEDGALLGAGARTLVIGHYLESGCGAELRMPRRSL